MTISKDRVKPSPNPDNWKLNEIFATGIVLGSYLAVMTVVFFVLTYETNFFPVRGSSFHMTTTFIFLFLSCNDMTMNYSGPGLFSCETLPQQFE